MQWPKSDVYACRVTCAFCVCRTTTELQTPSLSHSLSSGGGDSCRSAHLVTCTRIPVWILCVHASADSCVLRLSLECRPCLHCDIDIDASMIDSAAFAHMPPWRGLWAYWISTDAAGPNTASTMVAPVPTGASVKRNTQPAQESPQHGETILSACLTTGDLHAAIADLRACLAKNADF